MNRNSPRFNFLYLSCGNPCSNLKPSKQQVCACSQRQCWCLGCALLCRKKRDTMSACMPPPDGRPVLPSTLPRNHQSPSPSCIASLSSFLVLLLLKSGTTAATPAAAVALIIPGGCGRTKTTSSSGSTAAFALGPRRSFEGLQHPSQARTGSRAERPYSCCQAGPLRFGYCCYCYSSSGAQPSRPAWYPGARLCCADACADTLEVSSAPGLGEKQGERPWPWGAPAVVSFDGVAKTFEQRR